MATLGPLGALGLALVFVEDADEDCAAVGLADVGPADVELAEVGSLLAAADEGAVVVAGVLAASEEQLVSAAPSPPASVTSPAALSTVRLLAGA